MKTIVHGTLPPGTRIPPDVTVCVKPGCWKCEGVPPSPGSAAAIADGCRCPVLDNHHGAGMPYPDGPRFWINADCPMHSVRG